jgi:hypothetical protein
MGHGNSRNVSSSAMGGMNPNLPRLQIDADNALAATDPEVPKGATNLPQTLEGAAALLLRLADLAASLPDPITGRDRMADGATCAGVAVAGAAPKSRPAPHKARQAIPRLAISPAEAAATLGVSVDFFAEHIAPELRAVRRGRLRLYPVRELERWLDENASRALDDL